MNAQELLQCAPRLSVSNCAYVILENGERGILVPPGIGIGIDILLALGGGIREENHSAGMRR